MALDKRKLTLQIIVGVAIAVIGGAILLPMTDWWHRLQATTPAQTRLFSGFIKTEDGKPIARAKVVFAVDENPPQTTYSDSVGSYTFTLRKNATRLHIDVYAQGFQDNMLNAPLDQSGAYEIRMRKVFRAKDKSQNGRPPAATTPSPGIATGTAQPQLSAQNCPGGICPNGNIYGNATVQNYNYGWQPPAPRQILQVNAQSVIDAMKDAIEKKTYRIDSINNTGELEHFVGLLDSIFTSGGWTRVGGWKNSQTIASFNGHPVKLEGYGCYSADPKLLQTFKGYMATLGYACTAEPSPPDQDRMKADVYLITFGQSMPSF